MLLNTDYSINITDEVSEVTKNTWTDWHLVPNERPSIAPPEVKTEYVDIPGMNGSLDYTEALAGETRYGNRIGSWTFIVVNGYQKWHTLYDELRSFLHGKKLSVSLQEQPNYIYTGRLELDAWKSGEHYSTIGIKYNLEPYKSMKEGTVEDWRWDDLTFYPNDIYKIYYGSFIVSGERVRTFYNPLERQVELSLKLSDNMDVTFYNDTSNYHFEAGAHEHTDIWLEPVNHATLHGMNEITFHGSGSVEVTYDRGVNGI